MDVEAPPRRTPIQEEGLSAVASHGLIGEREYLRASRGRLGIGHCNLRTPGRLSRNGAVTMHHLRNSRSPTRSCSRGMNAPCSRRTDLVQCHYPASLAHRLGLALVERTHLALAVRTRCNVIAPRLSRNEATDDPPNSESSHGEIVCYPDSGDVPIFRIIPGSVICFYRPIVDVEAPPGRTPNSKNKADRRLPLTACCAF